MASDQTADEVKEKYVTEMGEELGTFFHALWNELAWLYSKWNEYVELYGTKSSRIDLLNQAASHFFRVIQDSLWEDILLHIARLTDSPQSKGRRNLTVRSLLSLIGDQGNTNDVAKLTDQALEKSAFCRDWRNRRIAHRDLELALKSGAEPLQPASRAQVREALEAIAAVLNEVENHFMDATTMFKEIGESRGAKAMLYVIDDGRTRLRNAGRE